MSDNHERPAILTHRGDLANGLFALYMARVSGSQTQEPGSFSAGYNTGWDEALEAMAQLVDVAGVYQARVARHQAGPKMIEVPR